jgi:WXG100 family type VII secretion target
MCPDVTGFGVSPNELQALDAFVAAAASHAHASVEQLRAEADALFAGGWHGPAASAFRLAWEQWSDAARIVLVALDETAVLVGAAASTYAETDGAVRVAVARSTA